MSRPIRGREGKEGGIIIRTEKSIYCPYCRRYTHLFNRAQWESPECGLYWIGECNSCHKGVLVKEPGPQLITEEVYPTPLPEPPDKRIAPDIHKDFEEALKCFGISAFRAAGVMARRALQCCCLDKEAKKGNLQDQIDWLFGQGIITKNLKDWAHEVRLVGNDAAHPQKPGQDKPITQDDAKTILDLLRQFTNVLYVAPAIAEKSKKSRQQKK